MAKKTLLAGRKRTSELTHNHAVDAKKEELLNLKSAGVETDTAVLEDEPEAAFVKTPEVVDTVEEKVVNAPKVEAIVPQTLGATVAMQPKVEIPKPVAKFTAENEVAQFVSQLQRLYFQLEQAGTRQRLEYTVQAREKALLEEIKRVVQHKAWQYHAEGLNDASNMSRCQAFVDQVRMRLRRVGIELSQLRVHPVRTKRNWR